MAGLLQLEVRDPRLLDIVDPAGSLEQVAGGFGFTEGPVWDAEHGQLLFSDVIANVQYVWSPSTGVEVFRRPSNHANGNALDRQGRVVSCEHATSRLVRHDRDGKVVTCLASHFEGQELNSPNDVIVDSWGRIWFTDPTYGRTLARFGVLRPQALPFQGVFRLDPDGTLAAVATDFVQPNGLCLTAQETRLLVNDTSLRHIRSFDVDTDGALEGGAVFAIVVGEGEGNPDGLKVDSAGHVFCTGPGGVHVFDGAGASLGVIRTPEKSANFCFGGPDLDLLYIAATTSIYRVATKTRGVRGMRANGSE